MNTKGFFPWLALFIIAAIADIAGNAAGIPVIHQVAKPLLMPALTLYLYTHSGATKGNGLILAGLLLSWVGDVLLMFEDKGAMFFIGGLVSFLLTHICYIIYFLKIKSPAPSLIRKTPWMAALVAAYGVSLVMFLTPFLGNMQIPVMVYAVVICTMLICSLHVFYKAGFHANQLFVTGAVLFAASDSMLAINKFYKPFYGAGVAIMLTYCLAQLCITAGAAARNQQQY